MPGSGKTTLAKEVASSFGLQFVDLDLEVERSIGKRIEEIFNEKGEAYFREVESNVLIESCNSPQNFVMATGGGTPCFHNNMELMKLSGIVIFLDVPPSEIANRTSHQLQNRPLLKNETKDSFKDRIEFLRSQRTAFYQQAHYILEGTNITSTAIIDLIKSRA